MMFAHFLQCFLSLTFILTCYRKMRFCPKCSLKIKANIEQCPICKVELLFCAEDEDVTAHLSEKEEHKQKVIEKSPASTPHSTPPPQEHAAPAEMRPGTTQSDVPPPYGRPHRSYAQTKEP